MTNRKTYTTFAGNFLCLTCPNVTFALQQGHFVPREKLAAKGLLWGGSCCMLKGLYNMTLFLSHQP